MENVMDMRLNWIVAYTRQRYEFMGEVAKHEDFWEICDSLGEAQDFYKGLSEESDVKLASLCAVADSWDYDTHPLLKGVA
jgi:hypothetical protein